MGLHLAAAPYIFNLTDSTSNIQCSQQVSPYTDKMHYSIAETSLHLPHEKGESMSLVYIKVSKIVLKHFRRKIMQHYSSTCLQVNNKCHTTKVPSNHIFLSSNYETYPYFIFQKKIKAPPKKKKKKKKKS